MNLSTLYLCFQLRLNNKYRASPGQLADCSELSQEQTQMHRTCDAFVHKQSTTRGSAAKIYNLLRQYIKCSQTAPSWANLILPICVFVVRVVGLRRSLQSEHQRRAVARRSRCLGRIAVAAALDCHLHRLACHNAQTGQPYGCTVSMRSCRGEPLLEAVVGSAGLPAAALD